MPRWSCDFMKYPDDHKLFYERHDDHNLFHKIPGCAYYCSTLVDLPNVWCHVNSKLLYTLSICLPIPAEIIYIIYNVDNTRRCIIVRHYGTMGSKISYIFFNQFSRQLFYCNNNGTIGLRCTFNQTIGIVITLSYNVVSRTHRLSGIRSRYIYIYYSWQCLWFG
jgi:spore coat protein U-like protein